MLIFETGHKTNYDPPQFCPSLNEMGSDCEAPCHDFSLLVAALSRFLPLSADKCYPFIELLKLPSCSIKWTLKCKQAFAQLKAQLANLLTLQPSILGKLWTLYVMSFDTTISVVLVSKLSSIQRLVYYFSRALQGVETHYPPLDKLDLPIIVASKHLRSYLQAHMIMYDHTISPSGPPQAWHSHPPLQSGP